jgi:uncharacterized protein Yka (UPF0111/DUF47 family)
MNDVDRISRGLGAMAEGIASMANQLRVLLRTVPKASEWELNRGVDEIRKTEGHIEAAFKETSTEIMDLEFPPTNPDHLLEVAKQLDKMSATLEKTARMMHQHRVLNFEAVELLESAAAEVQQGAEDMASCVSSLGRDHAKVEAACDVLEQREKAVDVIRDHFNRIATKGEYALETQIWIREALGNLEMVTDIARDLTITLRVISKNLERHRKMDIERGLLS